MMRPTKPVATDSRNRVSTRAPHSSMTCRLFQTSAQLVPIAVRASTRWSSIIGMEKAEIAKEKAANRPPRSEEHTSELQSLMRISYAVFCLKTKKQSHHTQHH